MQLAREFTDDQDLSDRLQKLYKVAELSMQMQTLASAAMQRSACKCGLLPQQLSGGPHSPTSLRVGHKARLIGFMFAPDFGPDNPDLPHLLFYSCSWPCAPLSPLPTLCELTGFFQLSGDI